MVTDNAIIYVVQVSPEANLQAIMDGFCLQCMEENLSFMGSLFDADGMCVGAYDHNITDYEVRKLEAWVLAQPGVIKTHVEGPRHWSEGLSPEDAALLESAWKIVQKYGGVNNAANALGINLSDYGLDIKRFEPPAGWKRNARPTHN